MKRVWLTPFNRKVGVVISSAALLLALAAVAVAAGHHEGSNARDRAKNASAGDPDGVTETALPIIGTPDKGEKPAETITPEVGKGMLAEFVRAQSSELKALDHRNKLEAKEIKTSQAARQKEWDAREKNARHRFFAEHTRGPDRRAYIKDFLDRHRMFMQALNDERIQRTKDQEQRYAALREEQQTRLKQFRESLSRNERPPAKLWPSSS